MLHPLLLALLLLTRPLAQASRSWSRMVGGHEARSHSTPYMAYLQGKDNHFCGGFLVAPNWVMTAAQCLVYKPLTVILGARTIQKREESWQVFQVEEYCCPRKFKSPKDGNDIVLLKLNGNATTNSYVRTIPIERSEVGGGSMCSTVGWGDETPAAALHKDTVTIIKQRDCLSNYPGLADNLICGHSGSAEGNAGDPLICKNKAYGIFSYRYKQFSFYTHIAPYLPWTKNAMKCA